MLNYIGSFILVHIKYDSHLVSEIVEITRKKPLQATFLVGTQVGVNFNFLK